LTRSASGGRIEERKVWDESGREVKTSTTTTRTGGSGGTAPRRDSGTSTKARGGDRDRSGSTRPEKGRRSNNYESRTVSTHLESSESSAEQVASLASPVVPAHHRDGRRGGGDDPEEHDDVDQRSKVIYKKRASRLRKEYDEDGNTVVKPVRCIELSSDEKSHASSISEGSVNDDDDWGCDDHRRHNRDRDVGGDGGADNGRSSSRVMERTLSALQGAKGGGMQIASMSKNALRGLGGKKGSGRKWQSALFM
jgi:hypothetical protein